VLELEKGRIDGLFIETGCALGGSSIVIAAAKSRQRPLYVYDVFGMIPPPSDKDGEDVHKRYEIIKSGKSKGRDGRRYYGYEDNLIEKVKENFRRYNLAPEDNNIHLVKGLYQDTLEITGQVALAHIDCDWYASVMTCLERIEPHLTDGAVLVIDDYNSWSGCKTAVDEYFKDKKNMYEFIEKSTLYIKRKNTATA
jgi:asparagine synthase (glutamine-hydrolysing)